MSTLNLGTNVQISGTNQTISGVLHADGIIPPGAIIYTSANYYSATYNKQIGNILTPGYLPCDGSSLRRTTYPELFAAIGTWFGNGTNEFGANTTFAVPDLRGEFIRCWDGPVYTSRDPTVSGRIFSSSQAQDWKGFSMTNTGQNTTSYSHGPVDMGKSTTTFIGNLFTGYWAAPASATGTRWNSTDEIRPRNIALLALIKY